MSFGCLIRLGGGGEGFSMSWNSAEPSEERLIRLFVDTETSTSEPGDCDNAFIDTAVVVWCCEIITGEVSVAGFGASQSSLRRFVPSTISSHTAVTYLAVAPFLTRMSGENPSCKRLRMISMYLRASPGEISKISLTQRKEESLPEGAESNVTELSRVAVRAGSACGSGIADVEAEEEAWDPAHQASNHHVS